MKDKINAIKEYLKHFPDSSEATQKLILHEYSELLGIKLNGSYYPRVKGRRYYINEQIFLSNNYDLTNHSTNFVPNGTDTLVIWRADAGRCDFCSSEYWYNIDEEWKWFHSILKSYNPLDYDEINSTYLYNLENGKKLIDDYLEIKHKLNEKLRNKIKMVQIEKKKKELEMLESQ